MNSSIKNLNQVLTFQLEGLYEIVKRLQLDITKVSKLIDDRETKAVFNDYKKNLADQRLKLKRIFGYLLNGPYDRKEIGAILQYNEVEKLDVLPRLRDVLYSTYLQQAIRHLTGSYTDARYIAMRLDVNPVVQLLDEILDQEEEFLQTLKRLSSTQINEACLLTTN